MATFLNEYDLNEKIIDLIKQHPHLYDPKTRDFKNNLKKINTFQIIAKELNITDGQCIKKWRNLRERFGKERRRWKGKKGDVDQVDSKPKWPHFKSMTFFNDIVKIRKSNGKQMETEQSFQFFQESSDSPNDAVATDIEIEDSASNTLAALRNVSSTSCERLMYELNPATEKLLTITKDDKELKDDAYHFSMTVRYSLNRMPLKKRLFAQLKITELLYKMEFEDDD